MPSTTCREAIAKHWPAQLQAGAITVLTHENGSERTDKVGYNTDVQRSQDRGCMQVNSYWQASLTDWADPDANVAYAYQIYQRRGNFSAWYAVCTPDKIPLYAGIWCTGNRQF